MTQVHAVVQKCKILSLFHHEHTHYQPSPRRPTIKQAFLLSPRNLGFQVKAVFSLEEEKTRMDCALPRAGMTSPLKYQYFLMTENTLGYTLTGFVPIFEQIKVCINCEF